MRKVIHITGTNGKGTVSLKIARALQYAGKKVGLYTSPHIEQVNERIQINGVPIPSKYLTDLPLDPPYFFSRLTEIAFAYFTEEDVEYAVIEVGIGGSHDVTNSVTPILSIITSIGYDHQEYLGETLEEIAENKSGIIKGEAPVVIGPGIEYPCIVNKAHKLIRAPRRATFQEENWEIAACALKELGIAPNPGLDEVLFCRFEKIGHALFDVAHNPHAMERLLSQIEGKIHVIYGSSKERNRIGCLPLLEKRGERIVLIQEGHYRLIRIDAPYETMRSFEEEWFRAKEAGATLLICGSFYIMHPCRKEALALYQRELLVHSG
ncbi:MAG: hypothetical protein KBC64_00330 [Simkaniaceae bacterium]|nr:hypothetical protein [Simkaniaceae bacterium]